MTARKTLFEELRILGLKAKADWTEIQSAYRRKALDLHPDLHRQADQKDDGLEFRRVTEAYERLRARHIEERMRGKEHVARVSSDPTAAELPLEELELRIRFSSSPQLRAASSILLAHRAGERSRSALRVAACDEDAQVRRTALEGLRQIGAHWDFFYCTIAGAVRHFGAGQSR